MARPLRIEYPGAWYHIMNRGVNRKFIFVNDEQRKIFLSLLEEIVNKFSIEIHAYCLMDNHYHLLVRTIHTNLSRAMRHLNGVYTQRFNRLANRDGSLFRGRYKAILIEEEEYLLNVSRYIHLNPVSAKLCEHPKLYQWSSYSFYFNNEKHVNWIASDYILNKIGGIKNYDDFICEGNDDELNKFYEKKLISPILGNNDFKNKILETISGDKVVNSPADVKRIYLLPELGIIRKITFEYFNTTKTIKHQASIYLSRCLGQYTYPQIAKFYNGSSEGMRSVVRRFYELLEANQELRNRIEDIKILIFEQDRDRS